MSADVIDLAARREERERRRARREAEILREQMLGSYHKATPRPSLDQIMGFEPWDGAA